MPNQEYFLGFDAREMFVDLAAFWDSVRRDQFLLRPDVPKPLSVDCAVWPYFFDPCKSANPLEWRLGGNDLWDDLEALNIFLESEDVCHPASVIGITLTVLSYGDAEEWCGQHGKSLRELGARSFKPGGGAVRLGYDVADGGMISSLSNCGFLAEVENVWAFREQWSPLLNRHHLFEDPDAARKFREFSNIRVEEHAPFFVYGIYQIAPESSPQT